MSNSKSIFRILRKQHQPTTPDLPYEEFLKKKIKLASNSGFDISIEEINKNLKPHNKLMVRWMASGGRRACFASFGLHKSVTQLEALRLILTRTGGRALIICPLSVVREFQKDAINILEWETAPQFIRRIQEAAETGIYLTNYETVRDGKLDPIHFDAVSLDEASLLRGFGGTKTFREFMRLFTGDHGPKGDRRGADRVKYRFVATATPSPNEYIELLAYADFLGVMDVSQAKTRFFKRDSTKADKLTIHKHKEEEFWMWVASWGLFVQKPSDITGNPTDDEGYIMPDIDIRWHELPSDHTTAGVDYRGQGLLFRQNAIGIQNAAKEKRESLDQRIAKMLELREEEPAAHRIIWHDLEVERYAIETAIPGITAVYGSQNLEDREEAIAKFSDGEIEELAAKPVMLGSGCNLQRHCHWAIYLGIGFKFNDFIQSIHRLQRFLQLFPVRIDLIYTEAERNVRKELERKWHQHNHQLEKMTEINKKYGLSHAAMAQVLTRAMGVKRVEITGKYYSIVNNDNVVESKSLRDNSIGLILTSWPFTNQYEYSPNYADFGHSESIKEFFGQQDYLTPELYRALMPGRIYAIHVKDRITPGGLTGLGFQTVYPFHSDVIAHMTNHGFGYLGMKTIVTDVVRENNQTYRLGWSEQCKDGSKMGVGMPEYLLIFRKPPTDTSNAYADIPVFKEKPYQQMGDNTMERFQKRKTLMPIVPGTGYSRSRWQIDAHGFARSSGDRFLNLEELKSLPHKQIFQTFKKFSLDDVYDFEHHVRIAEELEVAGKLPTGFMLLQPQSWSDEVWADITRMRTFNGSQWSQGKEMHLCPLQFDIAYRVITQMSNPGDEVLDPFGGLMTVPYWGVKLGRYGRGFELNSSYFLDGSSYMKAVEHKLEIPSMFDLINEELSEVENAA